MEFQIDGGLLGIYVGISVRDSHENSGSDGDLLFSQMYVNFDQIEIYIQILVRWWLTLNFSLMKIHMEFQEDGDLHVH